MLKRIVGEHLQIPIEYRDQEAKIFGPLKGDKHSGVFFQDITVVRGMGLPPINNFGQAILERNKYIHFTYTNPKKSSQSANISIRNAIKGNQTGYYLEAHALEQSLDHEDPQPEIWTPEKDFATKVGLPQSLVETNILLMFSVQQGEDIINLKTVTDILNTKMAWKTPTKTPLRYYFFSPSQLRRPQIDEGITYKDIISNYESQMHRKPDQRKPLVAGFFQDNYQSTPYKVQIVFQNEGKIVKIFPDGKILINNELTDFIFLSVLISPHFQNSLSVPTPENELSMLAIQEGIFSTFKELLPPRP